MMTIVLPHIVLKTGSPLQPTVFPNSFSGAFRTKLQAGTGQWPGETALCLVTQLVVKVQLDINKNNHYLMYF
jgi:hypothetical protein